MTSRGEMEMSLTGKRLRNCPSARAQRREAAASAPDNPSLERRTHGKPRPIDGHRLVLTRLPAQGARLLAATNPARRNGVSG